MININSTNREKIIHDLLPDLTPLLDVMFMLIIFLILTTNISENFFDISLPEDKENISSAINPRKNIKITIFSKKNKLALNNNEFDNFKKFEKYFLKNITNQELPVVIYADKKAAFEEFMEIITFLRKNGYENTDIIMN